MQEKIKAIQALLADARSTNDFGGNEDPDGCLHPGGVDFDKLEERIICVLEDREYVPPKQEILPHTIINPVPAERSRASGWTWVRLDDLPLNKE